jgi:hypothetical protein
MLTALTRSVVVVAGLFGLMLLLADGLRPATAVLALWGLLPYAICLRAGRSSLAPAARTIGQAGTLVCAALALLAYGSGFFLAGPDPQVGLLLVFVPLWQCLGALLLWVACTALDPLLRRRGDAETIAQP